MDKSEARINTEKINAAIKVIEQKTTSAGRSNQDLTRYKLEDGTEVSTRDRAVQEVPHIATRIPSDDEVFDPSTGLPNHQFLREHFIHEGRLSTSQTLNILQKATDLFASEPNLINVPAPVTLCGDIHGQYYDLMKLFEVGGDPATTPYLFLGDYVDRGSFSFECLIYLYSLKINFHDHFWLLRGNHECKHLSSYFTFKNECLHKYSLEIYEACCQSFNSLPLAAIMNGQYFCVHGGISPELLNVQDVNKINRFRETPSRGLMCDLLWADPTETYDEDGDREEKKEKLSSDDGKRDPLSLKRNRKLFVPNSVRGCSYAFTYKAACEFLQRNGLLSIIRAHEAQDAGYRMYKNTKTLGFPSLLTLFSAPNYLDTYNNKAAVLKYENNVMNIRQFNMSPHPYWLPDFMDVFTWSLPFVGEKVTEMLVSILNICTEDELEDELPVIKEDVGNIDLDSTKTMIDDETKETKSSLLENEQRRRNLRNKILAIAKVSRMYSVLRQESEKVQYLKNMNQGLLPRGALAHGPEGLDETLTVFERARKEDLINEKLPPSLEDVQKEKNQFFENVLKRAEQ